MTIDKIEQNKSEQDADKLFDNWVDEFFSNSSVDLEILRKAFNSLLKENKP